MFIQHFLSSKSWTPWRSDGSLFVFPSTGMVSGTLAAMSLHGRFAEIGKRDIWSPQRMAQERPDIRYQLVAIDFLPPQVLQHSMAELSRMLAAGQVQPLQSLAYDFSSIQTAFRQFSQAQHVGKIISRVAAPTENGKGYVGSWVISGGLGALGALTADWLASQRQRHIILLGRSGRSVVIRAASEGCHSVPTDSIPASPGTCRTPAGPSAKPIHSAEIVMLRCDTAMAAEAKGVLDTSATSSLPPVTGFINSAGVLADGVLGAQSVGNLRTVFAPKLTSSIAIYAAIDTQPLEQLVLYSSAASLFGAPGQSNYAAANAALEDWTERVSTGGIGSIAIQWGAWAAGVESLQPIACSSTSTMVEPNSIEICAGMADDPAIMQRAKRTGLGLIKPEQGLDGLRSILVQGLQGHRHESLMAAVPVEWGVLLKGTAPHIFSEFAVATVPSAGPGRKTRGRRLAAEAEASSAKPALTADYFLGIISEVTQQVLGTAVAPAQPLMEAGLDSLGAVELRNSLTSRFNMELPATIMFDYPTTGAIASFMLENMPADLAVGMAARSEDSEAEPQLQLIAGRRRDAPRRRQRQAPEPQPRRQPSEMQDAVLGQISQVVASVLGRDVDRAQPLMEAGLDSLGVVELRNALSTKFAVELPATVILDFPSISALGGFIVAGLGDGAMEELEPLAGSMLTDDSYVRSSSARAYFNSITELHI